MPKTLKILCIDDDSAVHLLLKHCFSESGHQILKALSGPEALTFLENNQVDCVLLDYDMPEMNGIEVLKLIKKKNPEQDVIMLTAFSETSLVVEAMKNGAVDFIVKPIDCYYLIAKIDTYFSQKSLKEENIYLKQQLVGKHRYENLIGTSPQMQIVFDTISKVANQGNTVLIQGESGTGKEQIAKAIHYSGSRAEKLFIPVDCGSINPNLIESELFGHEKGSFTGAYQQKTGLLKAVGDGTLFFDEVGELPLQMQTKLLRTLQEKEFRPVGSTKTEKIDARILAATNRDLLESVENGEFRMDLFYRLNVVFIDVPPLRERKDDIAVLARHFIKKFNSPERHVEGLAPETLNILERYTWPGNIRELENVMERAFILGTGVTIMPEDLPDSLRNENQSLAPSPLKPKSLDDYEKEAIIKALSASGGNRLEAARMLGIGKSTLYTKLKKYNFGN